VTVDHALHELNQELKEKNFESKGVVETIIIYDERHGKLNCWGMWIEPSFLTALNVNHSTTGKRTTCWIAYPKRAVLTPAYRKGLFIHSSSLGITGREFFIALVNIPQSLEDYIASVPYELAA